LWLSANRGGILKYDTDWQTVPITATGPISPVLSLTYIPDNILLAGTAYDQPGVVGLGVFRSPDNGLTWTLCSSGLPSLNVYQVMYANGVAWAATMGGVARSGDKGQTWVNRSNGLPGGTCGPRRIVADPWVSSVLYAGTCGGLYITRDWGQSWQLEPGVLAYIDVRGLAAVRDGTATKLYAAVPGGATGIRGPSREILSPQAGSFTRGGVYQKTIQWSWQYLPMIKR
jgi:hypothetical protein